MRIQLFAISIICLIVTGWDGYAQVLVQKNIGATTPIAWGDYDNDGDMDLLQHNGTALSILKNNLVGTTATFVDAGITLPNVNPSSVGWIDLNNDGFLDIYYADAGNVFVLVSQQGVSFQLTTMSVGGENISIIADWGDIDGDGDQDFIGGGLIMRNMGNNRFEVSQRLGSNGRTSFYDANYDGELDFYSRNFLYINKGGGVFELQKAITNGSPDDVYGDLLHYGVDDTGNNVFINYYRHNISFTQYVNVWDLRICGGADGGSSFQFLNVADFDNDGINDVLLRENSSINLYSSSSVTGTGNCNNIVASLAVPAGRTEAADFDKDGDLDVFVGVNVFENKTVTVNAAPAAPTNLSQAVEEISETETAVTLSWNAGTDDKTPPAALSYNVIVKRGPYIVFTDGIGAVGNQTLAQRGNSGYRTSLVLSGLPKANYTWTVQAVDASFKTSTLSAEKTFSIESGPDLVTPVPIVGQYSATYDEIGDRYLLTYLKNGDVMGQWADGKSIQPNGAEFKINTTGSASSHIVGYNAVKNEFMVSWLEVNGDTKKIYAKNLLSAGANTHAAKVIYTTTDTLKTFLGGDKVAVDPTSGKYLIPYFQTRTDLTRPKTKFQGVPVTYYPYGLLDVFGIKFSASGTTITNETPKLIQTKSVPDVFAAVQTRNFVIQSAVEFDINSKMYGLTWNFMGERRASYGSHSSGEITSILETGDLSLVVVDENLVKKSENSVGGGGRNHSLLYNSISDQFIFVWSYWTESTNASGSDDYSFDVYQRIFSLNNDGTVAFARDRTLVSKPTQITDFGSGLPSVSFSKKRNEYLITWTKGIASGAIGVLGEGDLFYRRVHPFGMFIDGDSKYLLSTPGNETIVRNNTKYGHFLLGWKSGTQNQLSIFNITKGPVPSVKELTPNKAGAGAKIIVRATGMGNTPSLTKVYFSTKDEKEAVVTPVYPNPLDSTRIEVTVPSGLGRNKVAVRVVYDDQSSNPDKDNILFENVDNTSVTSVVPLVGTPGEIITITGVNFPIVAAELQVMFGSVQAATTDIVGTPSPTTIQVKVPQAAVRGSNQPIGVVIQGILNNYSGGTFRVIRPPVIETVKSLGPGNKYITGTPVLLTGRDFSDRVADLIVKLGDIVVPSDSIVAGNTSLIFPVPIGAEGDLKFQVHADDRVAESSDNYTVTLGSEVFSSPPKAKDFVLTDANDTIQLNLRVYSGISVDKINFWSKGISESEEKFVSKSLNGMNDSKLMHVVDEANFTNDPIGLEAYYEVIDKSAIVKKSKPFKIYKNFKSADPSNEIPDLQHGGDISDYQIVSIPYILSPSNIPVVFKDVFNEYGYDEAKWRILHYDPAQSKYQEYNKGLNTVEPGKGYWLIQRYEHNIFFEGARTVDVDDNGNYEIELKNGWNQIGNPFNFNISWADIKERNNNNPAIESFKTFKNGALVEAPTIDRFRGGFVRYNGGADAPTYKLKIKAEDKHVDGGRTKDKNFISDLDGKEWRVALDLSAGELKNLISSFGMHPRATNDVDEKDEHKLPAFVQSLDLSFPHSLSTSIVETNDYYSWDFELTNTTDSKEVTIRWDNSGFGDNDRELYLHDNVEQRLIDMRKENHYTFVYREGYNFRLHYGDKSYMERIARPSDVVLSDAYPNPMRSTTTIPFTVNKDKTHVHLAIYTLQGQEVQTLVNGDLSAGFYEFEWDGKGPGGDAINSGVVIYRLQTSESGGGVKSLFKKLSVAP